MYAIGVHSPENDSVYAYMHTNPCSQDSCVLARINLWPHILTNVEYSIVPSCANELSLNPRPWCRKSFIVSAMFLQTLCHQIIKIQNSSPQSLWCI